MGIYDREYYRKDGPSLLGYFASSGQACKYLVLANIVIYLVQLMTARPDLGELGPFTDALAMKPQDVFYQGEIWRLLTGGFLHSPYSWTHIVFNMLCLWFFGPPMEDLYGAREFLAFYLAAAVVGNLFWGLTSLIQVRFQPEGPFPTAIGASGAVMAVMTLCALHFPNRTVLFMFILPIPLWLLVVLYAAGDLFIFLKGVNLGVAVAVHLGGAAFALFYHQLGWRLTGIWGGLRAWARRRPRLRVYHEPPAVTVGGPAHSPFPADEQLEAKADEILEKVSRQGMASLTEEERQVLKRASEQYKRKRT